MPRHTPHTSDAETDYSSRRMSSSAASDSSLQSRPDKRAFDFSPSASPVPKRSRPEVSVDPQSWADHSNDDARSELSSNSPRVQLPSIASQFHDRHELRRASLPSTLHDDRLRLPMLVHRPSQSQSLSASPSGLTSYQFPGPSSESHHGSGGGDDGARRPRVDTDTQIAQYHDYPGTALSSTSSFSFPGNSPLSGAPEDNWASGIARPSSTPSQVPGALSPSLKYDDGLRQNSQSLYGGVTRISGQHHHANTPDRARGPALAPSIKTESDWSFHGQDFASMAPAASAANHHHHPSGMPSPAAAPAIAVTASPQRSPQAAAQASLVERPPRKRGKLPKPVTDYLKDWLHRHSDHPYPSEEEKKQLCNATGLSMSQVSNWMINVRIHFFSLVTFNTDEMSLCAGTSPHPRTCAPRRRGPPDEPAVRHTAAVGARHGTARVDAGGQPHAVPPALPAVPPRVLVHVLDAAHGRHDAQHELEPRVRREPPAAAPAPRAPPLQHGRVRARRRGQQPPVVRLRRGAAPVVARRRFWRGVVPRRADERAGVDVGLESVLGLRQRRAARVVAVFGAGEQWVREPRVARWAWPSLVDAGAVYVPGPWALGVPTTWIGVYDASLNCFGDDGGCCFFLLFGGAGWGVGL